MRFHTITIHSNYFYTTAAFSIEYRIFLYKKKYFDFINAKFNKFVYCVCWAISVQSKILETND